MPGLLLDTLNGKRADRVPLWLMRQAGRYLPEYRALREQKGGFLAMAYDSEAACEITLQPIDRFGFDGAILFSDILIVPHALGQHLEFLAGEGPKLSPALADASLEALAADRTRYEPIYETVRLCRQRLPQGVTMLGFAGSPWTVATYMVAGEGSRDQHAARAMAYGDIPFALSDWLLALSDNPIVILLIINAALLVVGTFMDMTPALLIFTPIFYPVVQDLGMDPVPFTRLMLLVSFQRTSTVLALPA